MRTRNRLDLINQQLWRATELLPLRPKPFAVLGYLAVRAGRLVPRAELVKAVWPDTYVGAAVLRGYIRDLRLALGDDPDTPRFIETLAHRGYRFIASVSEESDVAADEEAAVPDGAAERRSPSLVGRHQELARLQRWLAKLREVYILDVVPLPVISDYCYGHKVIFVDKETFVQLYLEDYDSAGRLYKSQLIWHTPLRINDTESYIIRGHDPETMIDWKNVHATTSLPDAAPEVNGFNHRDISNQPEVYALPGGLANIMKWGEAGAAALIAAENRARIRNGGHGCPRCWRKAPTANPGPQRRSPGPVLFFAPLRPRS